MRVGGIQVRPSRQLELESFKISSLDGLNQRQFCAAECRSHTHGFAAKCTRLHTGVHPTETGKCRTLVLRAALGGVRGRKANDEGAWR